MDGSEQVLLKGMTDQFIEGVMSANVLTDIQEMTTEVEKGGCMQATGLFENRLLGSERGG